MAILFIIALNPYAVTPEPRTDSKPFRRCLVRKTGFGSCRRELFQDYFRQSFESSPGVQRVATLGVFLRYFLHAAKSTNPFPLRESFEVLQTSNQRTQTANSHNQIKSFFRLAAVSLPERHAPRAFSPPAAAAPIGASRPACFFTLFGFCQIFYRLLSFVYGFFRKNTV